MAAAGKVMIGLTLTAPMRVWKQVRHIWAALAARSRFALGYPAVMHTADRQVLEQQILPALVRDPAITRVLFVGCDWYTAHYERLLPGLTLHTLDHDPRRRRYGTARHHVAALQDIEMLFPAGSLDVIVCNGVYGWGLDALDDCERAFRACAVCLRFEGSFVLGWNAVPAHDPAPLAQLSMAGFAPHVFSPIGTARLEVAGSIDRHHYAFYRRTDELVEACAGGLESCKPGAPPSEPCRRRAVR